MRLNAFRAIEHIKQLNMLKKDMVHAGVPVSSEDFRAAFKTCGIPSNAMFWVEFRNSGLLTRVEGHLFVWTNAVSPIHYQQLQSIYNTYQRKVNRNYDTYREKKKRQELLKSKEIEDAVNLLKENGFEIFAPKGNLYQKLQWHILKVVKIVVIWFSPDYLLSLLSYSN